MKKWILVCLLAFAAGSANARQFSKAKLQATGLTCAMCSNAINKALLQLSFVEDVKSEIKTSSFLIRFRPEAEASADAIRKAVEEAGFSVGKLEMTGRFDAGKIEKDQHVKIGNAYYHFLGSGHGQLNGEQTITMADKGFLTPKHFKKVSGITSKKCMQTGRAESCCTEQGVEAGARVYHVTVEKG